MKPFCLLALFLGLCPLAIYAQTAEVGGAVRDQSGAVIPKASLEFRNEETGIRRQTNTNSDGLYHVAGMDPGKYDLTAQAAGFKTSTRDGIVLEIEQRAQFDFTLQAGGASETVNVEDVPALVDNTPQIGTTITQREYERLPLIQIGRIRSPAAFVLLAPGVQGSVRLDGSQYASASNQVEVHGQANFTIEYLMDGLPVGPGYGNFNESAPSVDAVREFRLITSQLTPEYGASGAAIASFAIASGTNDFHGDFYDYFRNSALDTRSYLATLRAPLKLNEFGVSIGGPIRIPRLYDGRNRTFFFFSFAGSRKRGADSVSTVQIPTPQEIRGDFSNLKNSAGQLKVIYDPATTRTGPNGTLIRDPFQGNIIPANRISASAALIAAYFPAPNSPLGYTGFTGDVLLDPDTYLGKLDEQVSGRHHLSGAVIRTTIPRSFSGGALPLPLKAGSFRQNVDSWTLRFNDDLAFTPTLLNSFAGGYNRFNTPLGPPTDPQPWSSTLKVPGIGNYAFPDITFGNGYTTIGSTNFFNYVDSTYLAKDGLSWDLGAHSLKFGGEWRHNQHDSMFQGNSMGVFGFTNAYTANPSALSASGDSFASFLLGSANNVSSSGPLAYNERWTYGGIYAQDQWRVARHLTLDYGLRWEWQTPPSEANNVSGEVSLTASNPAAGNLPGAVVFAGGANGRTFGSTDLSSFGPRVGATFSAGSSLVFRAGYGVYYSKWTSGSNQFGIDSPGFEAFYSNTSQDAGVTPAGSFSAGLPALSATPNLSSTVLNGQNATFADGSSWKLPRTQNYSAGLQLQPTKNTVFEVDYVGIHGTRQNAYLLSNINQVDPRYLSLGSVLTQSATSPAAIAAGIHVPYPGFTGTVAQALRPFPQYQTLTSYFAKLGKSTYNALQVEFRQRTTRGLSYDLNYTWSKNLGYPDTVNIAVGGVNNLPENSYNLTSERSLLPNDVPHAFVGTWAYDLPFGASHRFGGANPVTRFLSGGWTASAVQRYQSGTPLQIYQDNNLPIFNSVQRPNVVASQNPQTSTSVGSFNPSTDRRINLSAFTVAPAYTFGNARPTLGNLRQFAVLQEDVALIKQFSLGEKWKFEFSGQAFNVANRHRFTSIVTDISSASFGKAGGSSIGRYVQLGAKFKF